MLFCSLTCELAGQATENAVLKAEAARTNQELRKAILELDATRGELSRVSAVKDKLEVLCRALQRQNREALDIEEHRRQLLKSDLDKTVQVGCLSISHSFSTV